MDKKQTDESLKITKTDETTETCSNTTKTHELEINGKTVRLYEMIERDDYSNEYSQEFEIDEEDKKKLTDIEFEAIGENMGELAELKQDEVYET